MAEKSQPSGDRRSDVLDAALRTFTRYGYRKTSMDDVAREAQISRPGLYFLFASKSDLFREAADRGVELDLAAAGAALADASKPMTERILDAFDAWAGRYVGPMHDTAALIDNNPDILGEVARSGPAHFESLLIAALTETSLAPLASEAARTLSSLSVGVKHQAESREDYRARMADGVKLLLPG